MTQLDDKYKASLEDLKTQIQNSELLAKYLEEEEEEQYDALKEEFEPKIEALHLEVAEQNPLQLELLEEEILDEGLEGLFLPRVLGYSVLRGALNDNYKYIRPQEHFKNVLLSIAQSSNFELLKNRIGQTVEVGFALSSDIWITNLIAEVGSKQVRAFLTGQKNGKYADLRSRHTSHLRYSKQFTSFNFLTATLPTTAAEVKIEYKSIVNFLSFRAAHSDVASESVYDYTKGFVNNKDLGRGSEHLEILLIIGLFFDLKDAEGKALATRLEEYQKGGEDLIFEMLLKIQGGTKPVLDEDYNRIAPIVAKTKLTSLGSFMKTAVEVNQVGYINPEAIEVTKVYYEGNRGTSIENACFRNFIFAKFKKFMSGLSLDDFNEYFELNKVFVVYMNILDNEKFNQSVKGISMTYVRKLLRKYTQKRSKDYQDIKKFVSAVFQDLGFLNEKEVKELFKTKRKKASA